MAKIKLITLPIGNSLDITIKAKEALLQAEYVFAEDTRVFRNVVERMGIDCSGMRVDSFHDHSDNLKLERVFSLLAEGKEVCFCSDAGSPLLSDPAYPLVREAIKREVDFEVCSGISAVTCALELSGLPPHPFSFHGFLPREEGKIKTSFQAAINQGGLHIFFESPHRILKSVEFLCGLNEKLDICVARELTKEYQSIYRFNSSELDRFKDELVEKGEFVLLFHASEKKAKSSLGDQKLKKMVEKYLGEKSSTKKLAKIFSEITEKPVEEVYAQLLKLKKTL